MTFANQLQNYIPLILFIGGGIAWFIRLEYKTLDNGKEIAKIQSRNEVKDADSDSFREKILVTLENLTVNMEYVKKTLEELKKK